VLRNAGGIIYQATLLPGDLGQHGKLFSFTDRSARPAGYPRRTRQVLVGVYGGRERVNVRRMATAAATILR
jgi:hypothetical protein